MPKDTLTYNEVLLSDKNRGSYPNTPYDINSQIEKERSINLEIAKQQDKIVSEVLHLAPHYVNSPSLHLPNLSAWIRSPNMQSPQAAKDKKQAAEKTLQTLLEETAKTLKLPLTTNNAESMLKSVITHREEELKKTKEIFSPMETEYENNKKEYYLFGFLRASKPEGYDVLAAHIKKKRR